MRKIILDKIIRIVKAKKILEKELDVKFTFQGRELTIVGNAEKEYSAEKVVEALNFGFTMEAALMIKEEELIFEILNIKDYTKRNDLERIRGRIIGTGGKTKKTLINLTECFIEIKENKVGIIGHPENMENATQAIVSLIKGAKQANVYAYLEHHRIATVVDLGLKEDNPEETKEDEEEQEEYKSIKKSPKKKKRRTNLEDKPGREAKEDYIGYPDEE
jgi:ribosomal RNA assembly protein